MSWRGGTDSVMTPESANLTALSGVVHFGVPASPGPDKDIGHVLVHTVTYAACATCVKRTHQTLA